MSHDADDDSNRPPSSTSVADDTCIPEDLAQLLVEDPCSDDFSRMYVTKPEGIFERTREGDTMLANFHARILRTLRRDDGSEVQTRLEIEAWRPNCKRRRIIVPSDDFHSGRWARRELGAGAIIQARQEAKVAVAIQAITVAATGDPPDETEYAHLGWREIDGALVFLHAAGGISAMGSTEACRASIDGTLSAFALPPPPTGDRLREVAGASLSLLDVADKRIIAPLLASIYRAPLGHSRCTLFLWGLTGTGKSSLAAVAQAHFGANMWNESMLPGGFESTANANELMAFQAKDVLLVIDDYVPSGDPRLDRGVFEAASRIIRSTANESARKRLRADATPRPDKPPRSLIVITGEELPRGHSNRARTVAVPISPGDVSFAVLEGLRASARAGRFAETMAAYLQWLARHPEHLRTVAEDQEILRAKLGLLGNHRRTTSNAAVLLLGLRRYLEFCVDAGALTQERAEQHFEELAAAIVEGAIEQAETLCDEDPIEQLFACLTDSLAAGDAHLEAIDGGHPVGATRWGWREQRSELVPRGPRIGYLDGERVLLHPTRAVAVAKELARRVDQPIATHVRELGKRLGEAGLLLEVDHEHGRERHGKQRKVGGSKTRYWIVAAGLLQVAASGPAAARPRSEKRS